MSRRIYTVRLVGRLTGGIMDPVKHEKKVAHCTDPQQGRLDPSLHVVYWILYYHWSRLDLYGSPLCVFVYWRASINACVCVCVWYFTCCPPYPTSWLAGRGQKGHCPQLVMIPTLRCLFVSIIKTPQGHQLQLVMSHRGRAHRGHLTCMKIDRLCHVTAVITRQSDKSYSDQASQRGNSNDILLLLPLNINMLQSGLSFMSENTKTTYSNTEQFEH